MLGTRPFLKYPCYRHKIPLSAMHKGMNILARGRELDELLQVWVVRHLQIIGEAASWVSSGT